MYVYIARQPIFTAQKKLFAYELLFRQTMGLHLGELSGDRATTSLLSTTFLTEGIEKVAGNKLCFINFTENLILKEIANFFSKDAIVVEILEDVLPTPEVMAACAKLSQKGYTIALDDFVFNLEMIPLIELANIIKIDYRLSTTDEIERILYRLSRYDIKYLAEKIETYEEFEHARKLGFHYFQGYFFAKPESIKMREVSSVKISKIRLLAEINKKDTSMVNLQKIIEADVAIAYKLLRYINSAYYYLLKEVTSIRQAMIYLGEKEIRRFIILVVISELAADKPTELLRLSLIRAKFCELLAAGCQSASDASELFMLGLFSLIDAILDTTMQLAMEKLPLTPGVKKALVSQDGPLFPILQAVIAYEHGRPDECLQALQTLNIDTTFVYDNYLKALNYSTIMD